MTEVLFYHLQSQSVENTLPPLLEKSLERGWRVVLQTSSEERADAIDAHLWTYRDDAFLPHGTWRDRDAAEHPVLLSVDAGNVNSANVRFLLDGAELPDDAESYDRIVLIFNGDDDDSAAGARQTWTASKARGFAVTYWQTDDRGRWQKKG
ncbi:MAG: DNA polymerase III subunit chi [Hyphomicrobiales bacterium]|nr:MAG: DNA polymerase III subunit chi [Hyphomicrobiales bacterium]